MKVKRNGILWRPDEVADYLGVSVEYAKYLMHEQIIPAVTVGRDPAPRTIKEHVDDYVNGLFRKSKRPGQSK